MAFRAKKSSNNNIENNNNKYNHKGNYTLPVTIIVISLAINIGSKLATKIMGLPFFFDTIGTILAALLGGFIPGIFVALMTNLLSFFISPLSIYYCIINIFIALAVAIASRTEHFNTLRDSVRLAAILVFISGGIGGLLSWELYGFDINNNNREMIYFLQGLGLNNFFAWYLVNLFFEIIDKLISLILVNLFVLLIPKKDWHKFEMTLWKQKPVSFEETYELSKTSKNYKWPLRRKIVVLISAISMTIAVICTTICLILFREYSLERHTSIAKDVAEVAARAINGDKVEYYLDSGTEDEEYKLTEDLLYNLLENTESVEFIYVYKFMADGCHVVYDLDSNNIVASELGDIQAFDPAFMDYLPSLLNGEKIEPVISDDEYGWLLTVYEPVYNSAGDCVCYAAVDISMDDLIVYDGTFLVRVVAILAGFMILTLSIGLWFAQYHLILPVKVMAKTADNFEYTDEIVRKRNVKELSEIDITTGDELEKLYRAFLRATEESTRYFEGSRQKLSQIEGIETSLVMALSEVMTSRNTSFKHHERKPSEYVRIIACKMKDLGYYADKLSEDYIKELIQAAPLHDIGKIAIPEDILNKPGKLNDEEFDIMKTHAFEGKKIIEK
nr:HD domain-containing protein [Butyrivibrio sp.]